MEKLKKLAFDSLVEQNFDCLAVGVLDFKKHSFECFEMQKFPDFIEESISPNLYFDLASLTKPLTLSLCYLANPKDFSSDMMLLLNHRGGLPDWGLLSKDSWKEEIMSYEIKESPVVYSDYSALRLMLEYEKKTKKNMKKECEKIWDKECLFWKDLPEDSICPPTGFRGGMPIEGSVHDPNAFTINSFCTHAGLFATINGLCLTIMNMDKKLHLLKQMKDTMKKHKAENIFANGWDTTLGSHGQRNDSTLAGQGASELTFGFLGFTGTSLWIDPKMEKGHIILSNATKNYWYSRTGLNTLRRELGTFIWNN